MRRIIFPLLFIAATALSAQEGEERYTVAFDTVGHYLNVTLDIETKDTAAFTLKMPVWTPGYYEILDFPKHLCDFKVSGRDTGSLTPCLWTKTAKNAWRIKPSGNNTRITYRVYANRRDVASSRVEKDIAFIAPAGVFMYVEDHKDEPIEVTYILPENWKTISTSLKRTGHHGVVSTFLAPDFDTLIDSPLLMGNQTTALFTLDGHDYELAFETPVGLEKSGFTGDFRAIAEAATALMGDVPYDKYTLIHLGAGAGGLEHLCSQACYTDGTYLYPSRFEKLKFLAYTAHEFFHLYNVKTIRPIELGPFDYDREALTPLLWFSEGVTCYYESRVLRLARLATADEQLELLSHYLSMDEPYEGHHHQSLRQCSYDIWLNFMNDDGNSRDVRINYYFRGPVVGLLMDIETRRMSRGQRSLDDFMRLLYNRFYKERHRGFTEEEFWTAADETAGGSMAHIRHIVETTDDIDYDALLTPAGLYLDRDTWSIRRAAEPTKAQKRLFDALFTEPESFQ